MPIKTIDGQNVFVCVCGEYWFELVDDIFICKCGRKYGKFMDEKDITANMAHEAIVRQSNEDEVAAVFRLHIMRFWSRERIENFCLHLLGIDMQEYRAWRQAVEQSRVPDGGESAWQKKWPAKFYPLIPFSSRKSRRR